MGYLLTVRVVRSWRSILCCSKQGILGQSWRRFSTLGQHFLRADSKVTFLTFVDPVAVFLFFHPVFVGLSSFFRLSLSTPACPLRLSFRSRFCLLPLSASGWVIASSLWRRSFSLWRFVRDSFTRYATFSFSRFHRIKSGHSTQAELPLTGPDRWFVVLLCTKLFFSLVTSTSVDFGNFANYGKDVLNLLAE